MSKRYKNLLIGSVVLMVLVVALVVLAVTSMNDGEGETSSDISTTSVVLFKHDADDVLSIDVTNATGNYRVKRLGTSKWAVEDLVDYSIDTSATSSIANSAASVTAADTVEQEAEDLSKYGLTQPQATVKVAINDAENTTHEFLVGNAAPTGNQYYVCLKGEKTVYVVRQSYLNDFLVVKYSFIGKGLVPAYPQDAMPTVNELIIERENMDKPIILSYVPVGDDEKGVFSEHVLKSPVDAILDVGKTTNTIYGMFGLTAKEAIMPAPTTEQLAEYGLDTPFCTVKLTSGQQFYELKIGNTITVTTEGKEGEPSITTTTGYYAMLEGIDVVYAIAPESLPWVTIEPMGLMSRLVVLPYIYDIEYAQVEYEGEEYRFDILGDADKSTFKYGQQEIDEKIFKGFYQFLLKGVIEGVNTDANENDAIAKFTFVYRDTEQGSEVIEFLPLNDRYVQVVYNGEARFIASKNYITRLEENIENVLNGKEMNMSW